ncbi:hypothetical protein RIEPE_0584 [Candidatus Riesia pediculicola USDA]|uniref:Uncharacterized protein n=1 Tax=Riesia pediculicola (strain USDA) TaxID=515618 RepID=D4G907_RIEPU|nr:hypothetical protein RIEPE_0590 [Candidatus Riesia pediculicola USDA]ADD79748.1 hypothetical protein RIEPE_0584 [Candidatus Riesia pediculicola USDA]
MKYRTFQKNVLLIERQTYLKKIINFLKNINSYYYLYW